MKKMVRFAGTDKYGIRLGFIFHDYLDLVHRNFTWGKNDQHFFDCMGDFETVKEIYDTMNLKDEVVK